MAGQRPKLPELTTGTVTGITVAIAGNVLISLALNLQKLAHKRQDAIKLASAREKKLSLNGRTGSQASTSANNGSNGNIANNSTKHLGTPSLDETEEDLEQSQLAREEQRDVLREEGGSRGLNDTQPLLHSSPQSTLGSGYGGTSGSHQTTALRHSPEVARRTFMSRLIPGRKQVSRKPQIQANASSSMMSVNVVTEEGFQDELHLRNGNKTKSKSGDVTPEDLEEEGNESDYLKSKLWWTGFVLMNVGEIGNFISYAWAPASVVAPLGTFALIANCFFAPLIIGERFRKRDLFGVGIAIIGAITVVLSSNASDARLDPDALVRAILQVPFIVYSCVYVVLAIILATLSHSSFGRRWVFVDVGLCAVFGGFTVLSTKAISTLLTMKWIDMFTDVITYPVIAVLLITGVGQIRYLNRALMRFDSKIVIPIQFVLFTLSAIIGSAILYGDFKKATFHQIVTFLYGCAATFAGVFLIAWSPTDNSKSQDEYDDDDDDETEAGVHVDTGSPRSPARGMSPVHEDVPAGFGTLGRRRKATLVLPSGVTDTPPVLRHRQSAVSMIGLSPAQHLLLVHTPPREIQFRHHVERDADVERGPQTPPDRRRRTLSWMGDDRRTRDSSIVGTLRSAGVPSSAGSK